ncbi:MAG: helix-turn-helix transcriptional regulator [Bacteroidota bacterium]
MHNNFSADKLAEMACLSRPQFFRRFRQEFGITPLEFITREKIAAARIMLEIPGITVSHVAYRLGFNTPQYFIKTFRQIMGTTPNRFRSPAMFPVEK